MQFFSTKICFLIDFFKVELQRTCHQMVQSTKWPQCLGMDQTEGRRWQPHLGVPHGAVAHVLGSFCAVFSAAGSAIEQPGFESLPVWDASNACHSLPTLQ